MTLLFRDNGSTTVLVAEWEYDPYGQIIRENNVGAATDYKSMMPFLYQTKWRLEYGLDTYHYIRLDFYDYGLRFYCPTQGQFINRDPIGEAGGSNLYAFVGNDPVNHLDLLGMRHRSRSLPASREEFLSRVAEDRKKEYRNARFSPPQVYQEKHFNTEGKGGAAGIRLKGVDEEGNEVTVDVVGGKITVTKVDTNGNTMTQSGTFTLEHAGLIAVGLGDMAARMNATWDGTGGLAGDDALPWEGGTPWYEGGGHDHFNKGAWSTTPNKSLSDSDITAGLSLLKNTLGSYYNLDVRNNTVKSFFGMEDNESKILYYGGPAGLSDTATRTIYVNLNMTDALKVFTGTNSQFTASVVLHESLHISYASEGWRSRFPTYSPAGEEASIRYHVEGWAAANGIPETSPRAGSGYRAIYKEVVRTGYSTTSFGTPSSGTGSNRGHGVSVKPQNTVTIPMP